MEGIDVVLANNDRVTVRVGATFLKIDADLERSRKEAEAIRLADVPTPEIEWHRPPALALAELSGGPLGRLGEKDEASTDAWRSVGRALRTLHDSPLPPWPDLAEDKLRARISDGAAWLRANEVLPPDVIDRNRELAEGVIRPYEPAFIHGDLHIEHLFVDGTAVTGLIDWSEARAGDPLYDLASLALGHPERLDDLEVGYGRPIDRDIVRGWWAWRCLGSIRWLFENGYGDPRTLPETARLLANAAER